MSSRKFAGYLGGVQLDADEQAALERIKPFFSLFMLQMDPPEHTRQRNLVSRAFLPRLIEEMRPAIDRLVEGLLEPLMKKDSFDLVADLAIPLPATVIMELLGIPDEGRPLIRASAEALAEFLGIVRPPKGRLAELPAALDAADTYLRRLAAERRKEPRDDLFSGMVLAMDRGDVLSEDELTVATVFLLGAGHETTANLLGNSVYMLLATDAGSSFRSMSADPGLIPDIVDELLRLESPLQFSGRLAAEDFEIGGVTIPKGQFVRLGVGAANNDPAVVDNPRQIVLQRRGARHRAFGLGMHYCLGATLALLEVERALHALATRMPPFSAETFNACRADRLLLHVDHPASVLAEMVRVLQPGGRLAVFDLDWATLLVDHPDHQLTDVILRAICDRHRYPWLGRALGRLLREAGMGDVRTQPAVISLDRDFFRRLCRNTAMEVAETGRASVKEVAAWSHDLDELADAGAFVASITGYLASGTKSSAL